MLSFDGASVPVGFLMSFRDWGHGRCGGVGAFKKSRGRFRVCPCAEARARMNLRSVGKEMFEAGGRRFLDLLAAHDKEEQRGQ